MLSPDLPSRKTLDFFKLVIYARWVTLLPSRLLIGLFALVGVVAPIVWRPYGLGLGVPLLVIAGFLGLVMRVWRRNRERHPFRYLARDLNRKALRTPKKLLLELAPILLLLVGLPFLVIGQPRALPGLIAMETALSAILACVVVPTFYGWPRQDEIADRYFARHPDQLRALRDAAARHDSAYDALLDLQDWTPHNAR